jgi:hypothetical protein
MNYILKKIEKKVYIKLNYKFIYLSILKHNKMNFFLTDQIKLNFKFKNIILLKNYLIESGILKY